MLLHKIVGKGVFMWELSISIKASDIEVAKFVYQSLKSCAEEVGAVVTCFEQFDNIYIVIACPTCQKSKFFVEIERCVTKVVCNFYKDRFLTTNLQLPAHENIGMTAFRRALINFDKETDIYLISKNLNLDKDLHLESFYLFKLKPLRKKWEELVSLANENSDCLVSSDAFFDLLKFLVDNLEVCDEEISVFQDENGYSIQSNCKTKNVEQLTKEDLVSSIIEMCPKKINLFCKSDDNTAGFLSRLFEERVNVCYNKSVEIIKDFSAITQN